MIANELALTNLELCNLKFVFLSWYNVNLREKKSLHDFIP